MICDVIATGSTGNAVLLNGEILLDCGVPYKRIADHVKNLRLVLLTHRHGDHFNPSTVARLHRERPTLRFGCCAWMVPHLLHAGVAVRCIDVYEPEQVYTYDGGRLLVQAFPLVHDVENCGYKIWSGNQSALYATDTANLDGVTAPGFDLYMIEGNYLEQELADRIARKEAAGEFCYEYRAQASHLSREAADLWLAFNAGPNSKVVYLHQHKERTTHE